MAEITISKLSSLNFKADWKAYYDEEADYYQPFGQTDTIRIQFYSIDDDFSIKLLNTFTKHESNIQYYKINEFSRDDQIYSVYETLISGLNEGCYRLALLKSDSLIAYSYFLVTSDLEGTIKVQYTDSNDKFDTFIGGRVFELRIEGGIYPGEISAGLENEFFRGQQWELSQLSQFPYLVKTLTIGDTHGVPMWFAEKLNYIFSLSEIYLDNIRTVRSESSVPEQSANITYWPLYVFKLDIEQDNNDIFQSQRNLRANWTSYVCQIQTTVEEYYGTWNSYVCQIEEITIYEAEWTSFICQVQGFSEVLYFGEWMNFVCQIQDSSYAAEWGNYICQIQTITVHYEGEWSSYVCQIDNQVISYKGEWANYICQIEEFVSTTNHLTYTAPVCQKESDQTNNLTYTAPVCQKESTYKGVWTNYICKIINN